MKKYTTFAKRNIKEIARDPVAYIFCLAFPVVMLALFSIINRFSGAATATFDFPSLIPGITTFSLSFIMLCECLLVSKDKTTSLLKRLYVSPMKKCDFVIGYALPSFVCGVIQIIICIFSGYILSLICSAPYISFANCLLLLLESLPMLLINVFAGIIVGCLLNDKSAPAIISVFISASGILGGAWMPLDIMGNFETFCLFLPFYPSVYLGRIITGASHTPTETSLIPSKYIFDNSGIISVVILAFYLVVTAILSIIIFGKTMKKDD